MTKAGTKTGTTAAKGGRKSAKKAAVARRASRGPAKSKAKGGYSLGREVLSVSMGCLGILFGLVVIGMCVGGWYACNLATSVLQEIGERDFSGPKEQINTYEMFLATLNEGDYTVRQGKTSITLGKESFTWVVQPRGSNEMRRFQWVHDYELNKIFPRTNPALCLDIELGYISKADAAGIELAAHEGYDPNDVITMAMVENNFSLIQAQHMAGGDGWDVSALPQSTVGAPRLSPTEAKGREGEFFTALRAEEKEDSEEDDGSSPPPDLGNSTDVVGIQGDAGAVDDTI